MQKAFITYNECDSDFVDRIYEDLTNNTQLKIVFDKMIVKDGGSIFKELFEQIGSSDFLICVLSKNSINRNWVQVEIRKAGTKEIQENNIRVIPLIPTNESFETLREEFPKDLSTYFIDKKFARFDSQDYDIAIQELVETLTPEESSEDLYSEIFSRDKINPFWRIRAEDFTTKEFINYFEDPEKTFDDIISSRPTLILGGRGSGKTMLLKSVRGSFIATLRDVKSFKDPKIPYFGAYHRASRGTYSATEKTDKIDSDEIKLMFLDQLILRLGQAIISEIKYCRKNNIPKINDNIEQNICNKICKNLRLPKIEDKFEPTEDQIGEQINQITDYARNKIRGATPVYPINALEQENLERLCRETISAIPELEDKFICFLIDEYENFTDDQKIVLNTIIKFHESSSYTIKIASKKTAFSISNTIDGQPLQELHDYDRIDMDFDITKTQERIRFSNHVKNICKKILTEENSKINNIDDLLEDRELIFVNTKKTLDGFTKEDILIEIKKEYKSAKKPWSSFTKKDLDYYYTHYGVAAEYRLCKSKPKTYAGFDDFVTFSSGNVRVFVELCGMSYIQAIKNNILPKDGHKIPYKIQAKVLENISNYYLWDIQKIPEKGFAILPFINDLGTLIREKSLTQFSEPESSMISISNPSRLDLRTKIINSTKEFSLKEILDTCVMFSVFHEHPQKGRRGKEGIGVTSSDYILNRIFAQALKISPRPMSSYTISCEQIKKILNPETREKIRRETISKVRKIRKTTQDIEPLETYDE